jgi:hypothetical protein
MVKSKIQLRNVTNVAANKTVLIDCPIGPRYHYIQLQHGFAAGTNTIAGAQANILAVRIKVNGVIERIFGSGVSSGSNQGGVELRDFTTINQEQGSTLYDWTGVPNTAPGVTIPIYFAEPWRDSPQDREALAWPSSGWQSFQIEIDLGAATTPTLTAFAYIDAAQAPANGAFIAKVYRQQFPAAGTSFDIAQITRRDYLTQVSLYPDSGSSQQTSEVDLRFNSQIIDELSTPVRVAALINRGMSPTATGRTANMTDLVMEHDESLTNNLLAGALNLNGASDLSMTVKAANAMSGTIVALVEKIGPPD